MLRWLLQAALLHTGHGPSAALSTWKANAELKESIFGMRNVPTVRHLILQSLAGEVSEKEDG